MTIMNAMTNSKNFTFCVAFFFAGLLSLLLEKTVYGGNVDENNIVQESFFLPLAFILFFVSFLFFLAAVLTKIRQTGRISKDD